jgi:rfaE bifunctional protein nucleotidyltransferase chain/domain
VGRDEKRGKVGKVVSLEELVKLLNAGERKRKVVFTNGCFDLIHLGHVRYLKEAKSLGDILVVGLNSDSSVKKLKGKGRPILPQEARAEIISSLSSVDYVVIFDEETPERLISLLKPDVHVKGGDYLGKEIPERRLVESYGGKVVLASKVEGYSTTSLIEKIKKNG